MSKNVTSKDERNPVARLAPALVSGARRIRTDDPLVANQVLYQLSYSPA